MRRRTLLLALGAGALAASLHLRAQAAKIPLIGYLSPVVPQNDSEFRLDSFLKGMRELGYVEGTNYRLERRWGEGKLERMPALAAELVRMKVDLIVAAGSVAVNAAKDATKTIPIVMPVSSDPVGDGIVVSLSHPGGNITGLSLMAPELGAKRLQILRELLPKKSHAVGVMWNPAMTGMAARFKETKQAAPAVGMVIRSLEVRNPREMEAMFDTVAGERPAGMVLLADPVTISMRARIVEFARENKLPAIYETRDFVDAGGLISYGPDVRDSFRRAARYVDKILKGAKPADLPIEQPARIELVVNLRTARALGITIPQDILVRAEIVQ